MNSYIREITYIMNVLQLAPNFEHENKIILVRFRDYV